MAINSNHLEKEMKAKGSDHVWSMINELVQQLRGRHQNKKKNVLQPRTIYFNKAKTTWINGAVSGATINTCLFFHDFCRLISLIQISCWT